MMGKVAVITGGSSGIGLATARALRSAGFEVYELSRREKTPEEGITHISADVSKEAEVRNAISAVREAAGRIDVIICNAGFGISGAAEFTQNEDAKRLMDVNLFGMVNAVKAVLPIMREQGNGRIICISSVAAPIAIPFQAWYSVSKAAVSTYASALRKEVAPFGIEVCSIMPGDIHTGFTAAREKNHIGDDVYGGRIGRSVAVMERDEENGMKPEKAGAIIARIAMKRNVKPSYAIGLQYSFFVMLSRLLPERLVGWIVGRIYAR